MVMTSRDKWRRFREDVAASPLCRRLISTELCRWCQLFLGDILTKDIWAKKLPWWNDDRRFKHRPLGQFPIDLSQLDCRCCQIIGNAWRQSKFYREILNGEAQWMAAYDEEELDENIYIEVQDKPNPEFYPASSNGRFFDVDLELAVDSRHGVKWLDQYFRGKPIQSQDQEPVQSQDQEPYTPIPRLVIDWSLPFEPEEPQTYQSDDPLAFSVSRPSSPDERIEDVSKHVLPALDSLDSFRLIKSWLDDCLRNHKDCQRSPRPLPTRLIDVGDSDGYQVPRLYITNESERGGYVALSYCWGSKTSKVLTQDSFLDFQRHIPNDALPPTIRDTIIVTRALGYRYLWVDSLTILQDSLADWETEAAKMCDVYEGADLVISADESYGRFAGLFPTRDVSILRQPTDDNVQLYVHRSRDPKIKSYYLATRGWALQEGVMPMSTIHFCGSELLWQCRTCSIRESGTSEQSSNILKTINEGEDAVSSDVFNKRFWYYVIHYFTRRSLSEPLDVMAATAGVAEKYARDGLHTGRYLAALWENDIPPALLWHGKGEDGINIGSTWDFPSWSWVDYWLYTVTWPLQFLRGLDPVPTPFDCIYDSAKTFVSAPGRVHRSLSGELALTGFMQLFTERMLDCIVSCDVEPWRSATFEILEVFKGREAFRVSGPVREEMQPWCHLAFNRHYRSLHQPLWMLRICSWATLREDWNSRIQYEQYNVNTDYVESHFLLLEESGKGSSSGQPAFDSWADPTEETQEQVMRLLRFSSELHKASIALRVGKRLAKDPLPTRRWRQDEGLDDRSGVEATAEALRKLTLPKQHDEETIAADDSPELVVPLRFQRVGQVAFRHHKDDDSFMQNAVRQAIIID